MGLKVRGLGVWGGGGGVGSRGFGLRIWSVGLEIGSGFRVLYDLGLRFLGLIQGLGLSLVP